MRALNIASGVAVLLTTLAFAHLMDHFVSHSPPEFMRTAGFWAGMIVALAVGILSFIGGCLLLRCGRSRSA